MRAFWIANLITILASPFGLYCFYILILLNVSTSSSRYGPYAAVYPTFYSVFYLLIVLISFGLSIYAAFKHKSNTAKIYVKIYGAILLPFLVIGVAFGINSLAHYMFPPLHDAIEMNDLGKIKSAIFRGEKYMPEIVENGYERENPIEVAVGYADLEIIKYFVELGVPISEFSVYQAARLGRLKTLKYFFEQGASPDSTYTGYMHIPALTASRNIETMKLLLAHKANPNATDNDKRTPLMTAALHCDLEKVQSLINSGARNDLADDRGYIALAFATRCPANIIRLLLPQDKSVLNQKNTFNQQTALHSITKRDYKAIDSNSTNSSNECDLSPDPIAEHQESIRLLLDAGANPNIKDEAGRTVLGYLYNGSEEYLRFNELCIPKEQPAEYQRSGYTLAVPLIEGYVNKDKIFIDITRLLIKYGAKVDIPIENNSKLTIRESILKFRGQGFYEEIFSSK